MFSTYPTMTRSLAQDVNIQARELADFRHPKAKRSPAARAACKPCKTQQRAMLIACVLRSLR